MRRRILTALAVVTLLLGLMPSTALAAGADYCSTGPVPRFINQHSFVLAPVFGGYLPTGARGDFYSAHRLYECIDTNGLDSINGPSYWVAVQSSDTPDESEIVQVGVQECHDSSAPSDSPCAPAVAGTARYFYAWGRDANTCPGYPTGHIPRPVDLGPATTGYHDFMVWWDRDAGRVRFYVDRVEKKSISDISLCWLEDDPTLPVFSTERWDEGDSPGDATNKIVLINAETGFYGQGWRDAGVSDANCHTSHAELRCDVTGSNSAAFWTVQP